MSVLVDVLLGTEEEELGLDWSSRMDHISHFVMSSFIDREFQAQQATS